MTTKPRVTEAQRAELLGCPALQEPSQQKLLHQYLNGELDSEHLADELFQDVLERWPALERQRQEQAAEEAERAREEAGMNDSVNRSEPHFVRAADLKARPTTTGTADEAPPTDSLNEIQVGAGQGQPKSEPEPEPFDGDADEFRPEYQFESDD